jgi:hypothetical protein
VSSLTQKLGIKDRPQLAPLMKRSLAVQFYLRRTRLPGNPSDFEVFDSSRRVVGRIMRHPQASEDLPWFWTITAREIPPSMYNRGYSAKREQAMADLKARWLTGPRTFSA